MNSVNNASVNSSPNFGANYKEFTKRIKKYGCNFLEEGKGSHMKWTGPNGGISVIPDHGKKDLGKGLIDAICKQLNIQNPYKTPKCAVYA